MPAKSIQDPKNLPGIGTVRTKNRFALEKQPLSQQRYLLERFSITLKKHLDEDKDPTKAQAGAIGGQALMTTDARDDKTSRDGKRSKQEKGKRTNKVLDRKKIMAEVRESANLSQILDVRQFDVFLKQLYKINGIRFPVSLNFEKGVELKEKQQLHKVREIIVITGSDERKFGQASAEAFLNQLYQIADYKLSTFPDEDPRQCLNVGIVSGSTTGSTVRAADEVNWRDILRHDVMRLPKVRVLALNVCLTTYEHLPGNANILVHTFSEKINRTLNERRAQGYGLSAPLLVGVDQLRTVDEAPQTRDVVKYTEPSRVKEGIKDGETELDIVLTGVGELPSPTKEGGGGSIFYQLSDQFGFDMDKMVKEERIVGDIAFNAITIGGEWVPLLDKYRKISKESSMDKSKSQQWMFYSAVRLQVLEKMVEDPNKSVILVARKAPSKSKEPSIYASIAGRHRYASHLIIDEATASELNH